MVNRIISSLELFPYLKTRANILDDRCNRLVCLNTGVSRVLIQMAGEPLYDNFSRRTVFPSISGTLPVILEDAEENLGSAFGQFSGGVTLNEAYVSVGVI